MIAAFVLYYLRIKRPAELRKQLLELGEDHSSHSPGPNTDWLSTEKG